MDTGAGSLQVGTGRRRSRVLRLRRWLIVLAVAFSTLLIGLIAYTRYRIHKAFIRIPHVLGVDIKSQTDGYTYSQSVKGRTLFTIHAAKAIQHTNGKTTLHDVAVTLYGPPGSNRVDSIRGAEFEYDQANGIVRAMGDTLLDIAAPGAGTSTAGSSGKRETAKRITMQGRGLVFLQKLGVASTTEQIRFQYGASQGSAVGADYETDTGILTLQHQVHLDSVESGHTGRLDADAARIDRNSRVATLQNGTLQDGGDSMHAPTILASLRPGTGQQSGSLDHIHATGGVILHTSEGQQAQAPVLDANISPQNQPDLVTLQGGIHLVDDTTDATAQRAVLHFRSGHADHLILAGQAHVRQHPSAAEIRTLDAADVEATLLGTGGSHVSLGELHATGTAKLTLVQPASQVGRTQRTELTAPALVAHTVPNGRTTLIRSLDATGGAHLLQDDGTGTVRTSGGDHLTAEFAPPSAGNAQAALTSVLQEGHVSIHESQPAMPAQAGRAARSASQTDAHADRAEFQASTNILTLTGTPQVSNDGLQLAAERILLHRDTGDAEASGSVRGRVTQATGSSTKQHSQGASNFAAETAHLVHSNGRVRLQGGSTDARLWSSTAQIEAPVIEADQKGSTLHAFRGSVPSAASTVRTVLVQQSSQQPARQPTGSGSSPQPAPQSTGTATRVFSRELFYCGGVPGQPGVADFRDGVRLLQGDDIITADSATAAIQSGQMLSGALQTLTADGHVRMIHNDQTATGTHLVYTAADRRAVLTGTPGALPVLRDPAQGTVTGSQIALTLAQPGAAKSDNRIEVTGASNVPVHTELDVPDRGAAPNAQTRSRVGRKTRPTP